MRNSVPFGPIFPTCTNRGHDARYRYKHASPSDGASDQHNLAFLHPPRRIQFQDRDELNGNEARRGVLADIHDETASPGNRTLNLRPYLALTKTYIGFPHILL